MTKSTMALAVLAGLFTGCGETQEHHFANRQEVVAAGEIDRGWIPDWLPSSAREIRERHNVDSSSTLVSFAFDEKDRDQFVRQCEPTERPLKAPSTSLSVGVQWWPTELVDTNRRTTDTGFRYFRCGEQTQFGDGHVEHRATGLAVRIDRPVAFFWR